MGSLRRGTQTAEMKQSERRKSDLLLRGRLARELGQHDEAARLFGEAALLEESLAAAYELQGVIEQVQRHQFSAVGCWSQAGNFLRALELCDALSENKAAPSILRQRAFEYARVLRNRRDRLWDEILQVERQPMAA